MTKYVYRFGGGVDDGGGGDRNLLGGKGANLDGMAAIGLPVPPGFTITTEMCTRYYAEGQTYPESVRQEVADGLVHQCKPGIRYGEEPCSRNEALRAHHASLDLVNRLGAAGANFESGLG